MKHCLRAVTVLVMLLGFWGSPSALAQVSQIESVSDLVKFMNETRISTLNDPQQRSLRYEFFEKLYDLMPKKQPELAAFVEQMPAPYKAWFEDLDYPGLLADIRYWHNHAPDKDGYIIKSYVPFKIESPYSFVDQHVSPYGAESFRSYVFYREMIRNSFVRPQVKWHLYRERRIPREMIAWMMEKFGDGDQLLDFYANVYAGQNESSRTFWVVNFIRQKFLVEKTPVSDYRPLFQLIASYQHKREISVWDYIQKDLYNAYVLAIQKAKDKAQLHEIMESDPLNSEIHLNDRYDPSNPFSELRQHKQLTVEQINQLVSIGNGRWYQFDNAEKLGRITSTADCPGAFDGLLAKVKALIK